MVQNEAAKNEGYYEAGEIPDSGLELMYVSGQEEGIFPNPIFFMSDDEDGEDDMDDEDSFDDMDEDFEDEEYEDDSFEDEDEDYEEEEDDFDYEEDGDYDDLDE